MNGVCMACSQLSLCSVLPWCSNKERAVMRGTPDTRRPDNGAWTALGHMQSNLAEHDCILTGVRSIFNGFNVFAGSANGAWVAWGQLYIDQGEEQDLVERGLVVNFRAEVQPNGHGMLTGTFSSSGEGSLIALSVESHEAPVPLGPCNASKLGHACVGAYCVLCVQ